MQYRKLGRNGPNVSELCLGIMLFGGYGDEPMSARIIAKVRNQGVNFIDSSGFYVRGELGKIVGRVIASDRDEWVVATKLGGSMSDQILFQEVENSLRRLGVDYVGIYYLHREAFVDSFVTPGHAPTPSLNDPADAPFRRPRAQEKAA